jgi:hypothetical protein
MMTATFSPNVRSKKRRREEEMAKIARETLLREREVN